MNPENTALTAYDEVQKEPAPPKSANPLLCERCQAWDDVLNFEPLKGDNLRLVELSSNKDCLICSAIAAAVDARREESDSMRTWPASRIVVRNDGPYFLDAGHFDPDNPYRIDLSDPNQAAIRLLMKLAISFLDEAKSTDSIESTAESDNFEPTNEVYYTYGIGSIDDSKQVASSFDMTPQFCLRYSTGDHDSPHLSSIEPWEVPLFDISLVRTWLQGCEDVHGSNCVGNVNPQIGEYLDIPARCKIMF
jgi:hypothetical protein